MSGTRITIARRARTTVARAAKATRARTEKATRARTTMCNDKIENTSLLWHLYLSPFSVLHRFDLVQSSI